MVLNLSYGNRGSTKTDGLMLRVLMGKLFIELYPLTTMQKIDPADTGRAPTIKFQFAGPGRVKDGSNQGGRYGGGTGEVQCHAATVSNESNIFCSRCLFGILMGPGWCRFGVTATGIGVQPVLGEGH